MRYISWIAVTGVIFSFFGCSSKNLYSGWESTKDGCKYESYYSASEWTGNCLDGYLDGHGTLILHLGDRSRKYIGNYRKGKREGKGILYTSEHKYVGEFKNNKKHGKGVLYSLNNQKIYEGEFIDSMQEGYGIEYYPNGNIKYEGMFKRTFREGQGTLYKKNGDKFTGVLKHGIFKGEAVYADGTTAKGTFINGHLLDGRGPISHDVLFPKKWSPIDYDDVYRLISGNTLIAKSKRYCSKNSSKDSCLKVAILEKAKGFHIGRLKATIIHPDSKKIVEDEWGYYAMNLMLMGLHIGIDTIPTDSNRYSFKNLLSINIDKDVLKLINPKTKEKILINIKQGQNQQFITDARNGNYKKIDNTGSRTVGQALFGKTVEKIGKSLAEAAKSGSTSSNESFCYSSDIKSNRDRQMCLATVKSDKSYCFSSDIRDDGDRQMCIASATRDKNYCYSSDIKSDRDKQMCLATTSRDESYCYSSDIKSDRDKQMCLALSTGKRSYCYSSEITSDRDRQMCIAQTQ